jgi:AcrR family transcriptional regulator
MRPKKVSDAQILEAARESFARGGFGISVDEIARRLEITAPAIYRRFPTKIALFIEAMLTYRPDAAWPFDLLAERPTAERFAQQLEHIALAIARYFVAAGPSMQVLNSSGCQPREIQEALWNAAEPARTHAAVAAWFDMAAEDGVIALKDKLFLTNLLVGSVMFQFIHFAPVAAGHAESPEAFVRRLTHTICQGCLARGS